MRGNSSASSMRMWRTSTRHDRIKGSSSRSPNPLDHLVPLHPKGPGWLLFRSWLGCTMTNKRLPEEDKAESTIQERVEVCQVAITAFEYYQTSFSYLENESMQEHFVGIPEGGGRDLISSDPLPPGSVYAVTLTDEDKVVLHRIEVGKIAGGSGN